MSAFEDLPEEDLEKLIRTQPQETEAQEETAQKDRAEAAAALLKRRRN